jgi:hypothetical protein
MFKKSSEPVSSVQNQVQDDTQTILQSQDQMEVPILPEATTETPQVPLDTQLIPIDPSVGQNAITQEFEKTSIQQGDKCFDVVQTTCN